MSLALSSEITELSGIGPHRAKILAKLNINKVRDLLFDFPRRYDDFSVINTVDQLRVGQVMTVKGKVARVDTRWGWRGRQRMLRIFVDIADQTGKMAVTWYNLKFLPRQLWIGREIYVAGTVEVDQEGQFRMRSPIIEFVDARQDLTHTGRITPVYSETQGVTSRFLRYQIKQLLPLIANVPEYMPVEIRKRQKLIAIQEAINQAHFPSTSEKLAEARQRLRFDELFFLQLAALLRLKQRQQRQAWQIKEPEGFKEAFMARLPFKLTGAQRRAVQEIISDLGRNVPMNRLLQGDVGSGKSLVALYAAQVVLSNGKPVLYLAPTEILACQQAKLFEQYINPKQVAVLIGSGLKRAKIEIKQKIASGMPICVIGTHALLQDDVSMEHCGLSIVDEQHRFGVLQRRRLLGLSQHRVPHLLSMTATPIPRTLTLTVYGDLDVSVLDELPPGRQAIITRIAGPGQRDEAVTHVLSELHRGRQAYVIAPLIDSSDKITVKSVKETASEMKQLFPGIAISLLHGQMASDEKNSVLNNFAAGAIQLLVATAIVEVGVNVPNASIMIIEGAERFGLAQLHQFRGRIGRGEHQSYCYLFPTIEEALASERLRALASTLDGFKIAESDLRLRGPGEMYGVSQSGFANLQIASLLDYGAIKAARMEAQRLLNCDPELVKYPLLRKKAEQKNAAAHFE